MTGEEQIAFVNARKRDVVLRMLIDKAPSEQVAAEARSAVAQLNVWSLRLLHRTLMEATGLQHRIGGQVREVSVTYGRSVGSFTPPPPYDVPDRIIEHLGWWRTADADAVTSDTDTVLQILARFLHGLVSIQPFLDGNGRLGRILIDQAAEELLGKRIASDLTTDYPTYLRALRAADHGELEVLTDLIRVALE